MPSKRVVANLHSRRGGCEKDGSRASDRARHTDRRTGKTSANFI